MMPLRYGSVCSGIEAASVAFEPLGWQPVFFSEIDKDASAVLAAHYGSNMPGRPLAQNGVPNHGDFTKIQADAGPIDLLVGGTPCQDFSIAGQRAGLDGERGNLTREFANLAERLGPKWLVWENVPGVFSLNKGRDFGAVLACFAGYERQVFEPPADGWKSAGVTEPANASSYGLAWRVLDAQYVRVDGFPRAVPQRRRRLFIVGYLGDWRPAAAVLFEREGLCGQALPRRQPWESTARTVKISPSGGHYTGVAPTLDARCKDGPIRNQIGLAVMEPIAARMVAFGEYEVDGSASTLKSRDNKDATDLIATPVTGFSIKGYGEFVEGVPTLRACGGDASGGSESIVTVCFDSKGSEVANKCDGASLALRAMNSTTGKNNGGGQLAIASLSNARDWGVRRLTPKECERLQGFPDDWTLVLNGRGKPMADGPRYRMLGNSMAVNCMRWIGQRIELMRSILESHCQE